MTQSKRRLGLAVPKALYEKISDKATDHGKTINSTCLDIFWEYFESKERPNPANLVELGKEK